MSIFDLNIEPMLIKKESEPFDNPDWIYELKLDGIRAVVYTDGTELQIKNKRMLRLDPIFPELQHIPKQVHKPCILDGELFVSVDGKPDFSKIQARALMSNYMKIELAARKFPAGFAAYDVLYYDKASTIELPLMERKSILQKAVAEDERFAISRFVEGKGVELFHLTVAQGLEGVVAKQKDSLYFPGTRTDKWKKFKNLKDDDFIIHGYLHKDGGRIALVLAQYDGKHRLVYKGHVSGIRKETFSRISNVPKSECLFWEEIPDSNKDAHWIEPTLVCKVAYMELTKSGSMRQPVFRGIREDKMAGECSI